MTSHFRKLPNADERIHGHPVIYCVDASVVNLARAATNGAVPSTDAEVLKVRNAAGGGNGGENLIQANTAMQAVYGFNGTLDDQWETIQTGITSLNKWFALLGWTDDLPTTPAGQPNVFHCVVVGPGPVIVDPLQKPVPLFTPSTTTAIQHFSHGGAYQSLGIVEYSHVVKKGHVAAHGKPFYYEKNGNIWTRHAPVTVAKFSATTTLKHQYFVMGQTRLMVEVLTGAHKGIWLQSDVAGVTYSEIV